MELYAVFTHETRKYFMFQIVEKDRRVVGTMYYRKDQPMPAIQRIALVNQNDKRWTDLMLILLERSRANSKSRAKIQEAITLYEKRTATDE